MQKCHGNEQIFEVKFAKMLEFIFIKRIFLIVRGRKKWRQEFFQKIDSRGGSDLWVKNSWLFPTFFVPKKFRLIISIMIHALPLSSVFFQIERNSRTGRFQIYEDFWTSFHTWMYVLFKSNWSFSLFSLLVTGRQRPVYRSKKNTEWKCRSFLFFWMLW